MNRVSRARARNYTIWWMPDGGVFGKSEALIRHPSFTQKIIGLGES